MHKKLIYNGQSSDDLGLVIQTTPSYEFPARDVTTTHVPGRDGDIIIDNGSYANTSRSYSLAKGYEYNSNGNEHTPPNARAVLNWLSSAKGHYVRLEDDYDPDVYRMAIYKSGGNVNDIFDKALTIDVTFDCKPQRFLKIGEHAITYENGQAIIRNPYEFVAKPKIKIESLDDTKTSMLTIKNGTKDTSLISLNKVENIVIDSEKMQCYDTDGNLINEKIGLNGLGFPTLGAGENTIKVANFNEGSDVISQYESTISAAQSTVSSEYLPYESVVASNESTFKVPSWDSLISDKTESFQADSYRTFIDELCNKGGKIINNVTVAESYTIMSPNDMPLTRSVTIQIDEDGNATIPDYADFITLSTDGKYIKTVTAGFYRCSSGNNFIDYYASGANLDKVPSRSGTVDVYFYPAEDNDQDHDIGNEGKYMAGLDIIQDNLPDWIQVKQTTKSSSANYRVQSINFVMKRDGYLWTDKSGVFTKAKWSLQDEGDPIISYNWNSLSKEFIGNASIGSQLSSMLTSSDKSHTYKFLDSTNFPQMDSPLFEVSPADGDTDLTKMKISPLKEGYNKVTIGQNTNWNLDDSSVWPATVDTTKSFSFLFIKDIPNYRDVNKFPVWLDNIAYTKVGSSYMKADLNSSTIALKLIKTANKGYYRVHTVDSDGNEVVKEWKEVSTTSVYSDQLDGGSDLTPEKTIEIGYMSIDPDDIPKEYNDSDRGFKIDGGSTYDNDPPSWLTYTLKMEVTLDASAADEIHLDCTRESDYDDVWEEDDPDVIGHKRKQEPHYCWKTSSNVYFFTKFNMCPAIGDKIYMASYNPLTQKYIFYDQTIGVVYKDGRVDYYAAEEGNFKIDNSTAWVHREANELILTSNYADTSFFRYLEEMPAFSPTDIDYLTFQVITDQGTNMQGNPLEVVMKIATGYAGYYRANTNIHWQYFEAGDELCRALINSNTTIRRLVNEETVEDAEITITPNWWTI